MQISNENILARYGALHLELAITREQLEQAKARIVELEAETECLVAKEVHKNE
jgi:hypothetical protein